MSRINLRWVSQVVVTADKEKDKYMSLEDIRQRVGADLARVLKSELERVLDVKVEVTQQLLDVHEVYVYEGNR